MRSDLCFCFVGMRSERIERYNRIMDQKRRATQVWLDKPLRKLEALIYDSSFKQDLSTLPSLKSTEITGALLDLTQKYDLPGASCLLIYNYLKTGVLSADTKATRLSVICDEDQTCGPTDNKDEAGFRYVAHRGFPPRGVELYIPPKTSKNELTSFIKDNWEYIERKVGKPRKVRRSPMAERDAEIKRLKASGLSYQEIATRVNADERFPDSTITYADIPRIIRSSK